LPSLNVVLGSWLILSGPAVAGVLGKELTPIVLGFLRDLLVFLGPFAAGALDPGTFGFAGGESFLGPLPLFEGELDERFCLWPDGF